MLVVFSWFAKEISVLRMGLFRIFDIWKPFPIHLVEEKLGLGTAIMADDVIAGIYTLLLLQIVKLVIDRFA